MRTAVAALAIFFGHAAMAQVSFHNVELRTSWQGLEEGQEGRLVLERTTIRFVAENGRELSLPPHVVKALVYSRVSGRRCKAALMPAVFFPPTLALMLTKGRKHYVQISFDDGRENVGAVEFKLHKSNYRGALRGLEQVTGLAMKYEQEGIKDTHQTIAAR
jgi:hypothetical protein